jgi:hypothetical protein
VTTPQAIDKLTETVISLGGEVQSHYKYVFKTFGTLLALN